MRKLVLSGFLASEEIYINQLEALLLVSRAPRLGNPSRDISQRGWLGGWMDRWTVEWVGGWLDGVRCYLGGSKALLWPDCPHLASLLDQHA